jgi:hypothetical protein
MTPRYDSPNLYPKYGVGIIFLESFRALSWVEIHALRSGHAQRHSDAAEDTVRVPSNATTRVKPCASFVPARLIGATSNETRKTA